MKRLRDGDDGFVEGPETEGGGREGGGGDAEVETRQRRGLWPFLLRPFHVTASKRRQPLERSPQPPPRQAHP